MKIDLTPLLQAVLGLISALITAYLIPWIKSHTDANKRNFVLQLVETAVLWVEQVYWEETGEEKFRLAKERAEKELAEHNLKVDADTLTAMIEEQVIKIHNELKAEEIEEDDEEVEDEDDDGVEIDG